MSGVVGAHIEPHYVAVVNPVGFGGLRAGDVDKAERAVAQQKATHSPCPRRVDTHYVTLRIDPIGKRIVKTGLKNGEKVVSTRLQLLQTGMKVQPIPEELPAGGADTKKSAPQSKTAK